MTASFEKSATKALRDMDLCLEVELKFEVSDALNLRFELLSVAIPSVWALGGSLLFTQKTVFM